MQLLHATSIPLSATSDIPTSIILSFCLPVSCSVIFSIRHILPFINTVLGFVILKGRGEGEFEIMIEKMERDLEIAVSCCSIGIVKRHCCILFGS